MTTRPDVHHTSGSDTGDEKSRTQCNSYVHPEKLTRRTFTNQDGNESFKGRAGFSWWEWFLFC